MKIAIDLNDVIRAYSKTFAKYYKKSIDNTINLDEIELNSFDLSEVFQFNTKNDYYKFLYEDYSFEIFGAASPMDKNLPSNINWWISNIIENLDINEKIELMLVSTMELGLTIQSTYFFLSKIGCRIREVFLPKDSIKTWDKCDVLITANPYLLDNMPDGKKSVKINMPYNIQSNSTFSFDSLEEFISDKNNILNLINNEL